MKSHFKKLLNSMEKSWYHKDEYSHENYSTRFYSNEVHGLGSMLDDVEELLEKAGKV